MKPKTKKVQEKLNLIKILSSKRLTLDELAVYSGHDNVATLKKVLAELYMIGSFPYSPGDYIDIDFDGNTVGILLPIKVDSSIRMNAFEWVELRDIIEAELKEERDEIRKKNLLNIKEKIRKAIPYSEFEPRQEIKGKIQSAINSGLKITFHYLSRKGDNPEERNVDPLFIIEENSGYLAGFCNLRNDYRIFRFESISNLKISTKKIEGKRKNSGFNFIQELRARSESTRNSSEEAEILFLPEIEFNLSQKINFKVVDKNVRIGNRIFIRAVTNVIEKNWFKDTITSFGRNTIVVRPDSIRSEILSELKSFSFPELI